MGIAGPGWLIISAITLDNRLWLVFKSVALLSHVEECFLTRQLVYSQILNAWRNYETNTDLVRGRGGVTGRYLVTGNVSRATWISTAQRAAGDSPRSRG
jgi:hypothetical protein